MILPIIFSSKIKPQPIGDNLNLGEIYKYILSGDWGITPEPPINDAHNVHYREAIETEKSEESYIDGGLNSGAPETR